MKILTNFRRAICFSRSMFYYCVYYVVVDAVFLGMNFPWLGGRPNDQQF